MRCGAVLAIWLCQSTFAWAQGATSIVERGLKWSEVTTDQAAAQVSAASLLGLSGEAVSPVENVRGLVVALRGLDAGGKKGTLGIAIAPGRTAFAPVNLSDYAKEGWQGALWRIAAATTLGYAQGNVTVGTVDFERSAYSVETSYYLTREEDPHVALALAYAKGACKPLVAATPATSASASLAAAPPTMDGSVAPGGADGSAPKEAAEVKGAADLQAVQARAKACREGLADSLAWNRARVSLAWAHGSTQRVTGGAGAVSLGSAWAASGLLGLGQQAAVSISHKRSRGEPVQASLVDGPVRTKNNSLTVLRLHVGTATLRGLLEGSNATQRDDLASQRVFRRAAGLDARMADDLWLNFRVGRRTTLTGDKTESASSVVISYSPKALLGGL